MTIAEPAPDAAYADWRTAVAGVLAKARKVDPTELPAEPEHLLDATTYDGLTVAPLHTTRDERPQDPLPGEFPFVRGRDATRDVHKGWEVAAEFGGSSETNTADTNAAILDALANGVSALTLKAVAPADLPVVLDGVLLDLAPITLDAGAAAADATAALYGVFDAASVDDRARIVAGLGAAPLTARFAGTDSIDLAATVDLARAATERAETVRAITVDGTVFHNAGASDAQELGAAAAAGLEYLRALTSAGVSVSAALRQLEFRFAATDDQFQTIAKFRAARKIWARVAQVCGAPDSGGAPQHAVTSAAMFTQRDPWSNMLRSTLAVFGAGVGGADTVTVLPFDATLPDGAAGVSKAFSARMARNTQLLLLEESHLGRVLDPGGGSWYVEELTAGIAAKAWEFLQAIEGAGGYQAALEADVVTTQITRVRDQRAADIAHRRTAVTGVNEFPNLAEAPLPAAKGDGSIARYGAAFEALRDRSDAYLAEHGERPAAVLIPLGPVAEHNARVSFAGNLLASGGVVATNPGPLTTDGIAEAVRAAGVKAAVVCGSDKRYGEEGGAAVAALRAAGVETVLLAGPEKAMSGATDLPDGYLTLRIDAVSAMSELLAKLGA
ncbi:MAG TPA: methylmalonyl-CoA mutase family protein [Aldersonia sp.]